MNLGRSVVVLDCGGKRSATPLSFRMQNPRPGASNPPAEAKAPSPLRSAGAVQKNRTPVHGTDSRPIFRGCPLP